MAIADVAEYAHLRDGDIEALAAELEAIRLDIEDSRGRRDRVAVTVTVRVNTDDFSCNNPGSDAKSYLVLGNSQVGSQLTWRIRQPVRHYTEIRHGP